MFEMNSELWSDKVTNVLWRITELWIKDTNVTNLSQPT
jgi:hypothetical protein